MMQTHLDIVFYQVCCKMSTDMLQLARFWLFKANRIDMSLITWGGGVYMEFELAWYKADLAGKLVFLGILQLNQRA